MTTINTNYHPINQTTWPRREYFYYFTKMMPTGFTVNATIDITATLDWAHRHEVKFNAAYLFLVSQVLTRHPEFRVGMVDDQLVEFDVVHPSYSVLHEDDHSISSLWTAYSPNFSQFYQDYLQDIKRFGSQHTPMPKAPQSANLYMIGSIPWLDFTSYTPLPFTPLNTYFPVIQAGQYTTKGGKTTMPLSFTIHHAVADGYHVSQFYQDLRDAMAQPEAWLTTD
ncbi:chloramphenicol acetyltransferase [Levilactobacillus tongjiangensis]|uniref:Chloramphenicol acetyltransferase n=1 Tax=Levilactobacillus tongjiangensis TaxID=2486023 RepID=A0ABW1SPE0_9LACO|nr:chloramphenicol acetyltransferase [Levilactobacillus tongjiangensis]